MSSEATIRKSNPSCFLRCKVIPTCEWNCLVATFLFGRQKSTCNFHINLHANSYVRNHWGWMSSWLLMKLSRLRIACDWQLAWKHGIWSPEVMNFMDLHDMRSCWICWLHIVMRQDLRHNKTWNLANQAKCSRFFGVCGLIWDKLYWFIPQTAQTQGGWWLFSLSVSSVASVLIETK